MNSQNYLLLLNEIYTNGYTDNILDIISVLAVISGICVIISKNPIVSVLHLIALFANVSFYLIIIGLNFIGLSYLIIYIGAVNERIGNVALVQIQLYKVFKCWFFCLVWNIGLFLLPNYKYENRYLCEAYTIGAPVLNNRFNNFIINNNYTLNRNFYTPLKFVTRLNQPKLYSTFVDKNVFKDTDFLAWFSGFIDAEGSFKIKKDPRRSKSPFVFEFLINLHKDDIKVLEYIQTRLNLGKINNFGNSSRLSVSNKSGILQVIDILTQYPLKTAKRLDFEDWQKAFQLYYKENTIDSRDDVLSTIDKIKEGMNKGRSYEIYDSNNTNITIYWLLGFIEGEGSFNVVKDEFITTFSLGQVSKDRPLLEKIVEFLISYAGKFYIKKNSIGIYDKTKDNFINQNPYSEIRSSNLDFLRKVLVPLLKDLHWLSKKHKDFVDWTFILELKAAGLHKTPEGKEIILKLCSQMNNNRLSTNNSNIEYPLVDRVQLHNEIQNLLTQSTSPLRKVKLVSLLDEKGELIKSFPSVYSCAKYLGVNKYKINKNLNKSIVVNDTVYYIRND